MALTTLLSKYGTQLKNYLSIWKKSGTQYDATHPDSSIRGAAFKAGLADLVAKELAQPVITVGSITDTTVALSWAVSTTTANAKTYTISRSKFKNKGWVVINSAITGTSTTASGLTQNTLYYFKVVASGSDGTPGQYPYVDSSAVATAKTAITLPSLAQTASLVSSAVSATGATLTWAAVPNATSYILERATNAGFTTGLTSVYTGALLTKADTGLTTATTYYYRVTASATGYTNSVSTTTTVTTS